MAINEQVAIAIAGLRAWGYHGVLPAEQESGQEFVVDLSLVLDMPDGDDISKTVDYAELATKVVAIVQGEAVELIETLADMIATVVLEDKRVHETTVTVHKPNAPIRTPFSDVAVTISRRKHD